MSDDIAPTWLHDLGVSVKASPRMPPGAFAMLSTEEQAIRVSEVTRLLADQAISDLLAEDCRSVLESADFVIRFREHGTPIICECCGTTVALMPEAACDQHYRTREWKQGIWETGALRKHTLRRCEWMRANG